MKRALEPQSQPPEAGTSSGAGELAPPAPKLSNPVQNAPEQSVSTSSAEMPSVLQRSAPTAPIAPEASAGAPNAIESQRDTSSASTQASSEHSQNAQTINQPSSYEPLPVLSSSDIAIGLQQPPIYHSTFPIMQSGSIPVRPVVVHLEMTTSHQFTVMSNASLESLEQVAFETFKFDQEKNRVTWKAYDGSFLNPSAKFGSLDINGKLYLKMELTPSELPVTNTNRYSSGVLNVLRTAMPDKLPNWKTFLNDVKSRNLVVWKKRPQRRGQVLMSTEDLSVGQHVYELFGDIHLVGETPLKHGGSVYLYSEFGNNKDGTIRECAADKQMLFDTGMHGSSPISRSCSPNAELIHYLLAPGTLTMMLRMIRPVPHNTEITIAFNPSEGSGDEPLECLLHKNNMEQCLAESARRRIAVCRIYRN